MTDKLKYNREAAKYKISLLPLINFAVEARCGGALLFLRKSPQPSAAQFAFGELNAPLPAGKAFSEQHL